MGTWTLLASGKGAGAASASATLNTTGAKLIAVQATFSGSATISDSKGNTWSQGTLFNGTTPNTRVFYCINPTVDAAHTITVTGAVAAIVVSAWNATDTPQLDSQSTPNQGTGTTSQFGAASFTPASDGCLLLGGAAWPAATSAFTAGSGWTAIDAQYYLGGTNYGVGGAYKVQTTAAAVPTTEVVSSWTGSANESYFGIAFTQVVAAGVTVTNPTPFKSYQRNGSTATVTISGNVTGATEDLEMSFAGGAYTTIATAVAAGSFNINVTLPAGQGTLIVRKKITTSASASVANVTVGDVFLFGGDSRANGRGTNGQVYSNATFKATMYKSGAWAEMVEAPGAGTIAPLLATQIMANQSVPVAFIYTGVGSTDVAGFHNEWAKNNSSYAAAAAAVTASGTNGIKAVLMLLGPNAIYNNGLAAIPLATYRTALDTLATNWATDLPGAPKMFVDVCGEMQSATPPDPRAAKDNIRGAVLSAWNNNATAVKPGPVLVDQNYTDNVHPQTDAELAVVAGRYWASMAEVLYAGPAGRGPRLSTAMWNGVRNQVTVVFDRALKTGLVHSTAAWIVKDNGTPMTVSGIAYHGTNPNALVFTMSAAATGPAGTTTLTFASGDDAVGMVVPLSTDVSLAVGGTINLAAEPIYAAAVAELDVTPPNLTSATATATSSSAASWSVTTDEANGTLYYIVDTNTTATSAAVKAGATKVVTATGAQTGTVSGLLDSTTYYMHFLQRDLAGNDSAVVSSPGFLTPAPAPAPAPSGNGSIILLQNGQIAVVIG